MTKDEKLKILCLKMAIRLRYADCGVDITSEAEKYFNFIKNIPIIKKKSDIVVEKKKKSK